MDVFAGSIYLHLPDLLLWGQGIENKPGLASGGWRGGLPQAPPFLLGKLVFRERRGTAWLVSVVTLG